MKQIDPSFLPPFKTSALGLGSLSPDVYHRCFLKHFIYKKSAPAPPGAPWNDALL